MSRLREVLATHVGGGWVTTNSDGYYVLCSCGEKVMAPTRADVDTAFAAHAETAVLAWFDARLAEGDVVEAVARAIFDATDVSLRKRYEDGNSVSGYDNEYATAALEAVRGVVGRAGEVA